MSCCGDAEEDSYGPPAHQAAPPPNVKAPGNNRSIINSLLISFKFPRSSSSSWLVDLTAPPPRRRRGGYVRFAGNRGGPPRGPGAPRTGGPAKPVNIDVPAIPFDELKKITNNFSDRALIGEGSYGRVYNATLSDGRAAVIKKLDTSASQDSDSDFAAQVIMHPSPSSHYTRSPLLATTEMPPYRSLFASYVALDSDGLQAKERVFPRARGLLLGGRQPHVGIPVCNNGFFA
jgi:hypothetical protein